MSRVITEGQRFSVRQSDSALCAENQHFRPAEPGRLPSHPDILSPTEDVAAGPIEQIRLRQRKAPRRSALTGHHRKDTGIIRPEDRIVNRELLIKYSLGHTVPFPPTPM